MTYFEVTRVDVCLYFIAPHSLRPVDISMIAAIGQRVPVVPVIGKVCPTVCLHLYTTCSRPLVELK